MPNVIINNMTYFSEENRLLLLKSNKNAVITAALTVFAGAMIITALFLVRAHLGRALTQITVTLIFAFLCCFVLVILQKVAENKRILSLFTTMSGRERTVECTFEREDYAITKNGLKFRQLYFTAEDGTMRYLVFEKSELPAFEAGQAVTLKVVGNVVKEWL